LNIGDQKVKDLKYAQTLLRKDSKTNKDSLGYLEKEKWQRGATAAAAKTADYRQ
jgi:hypothetical protein